MKKRTRIMAWLYSILTAYSLVLLGLVLLNPRGGPHRLAILSNVCVCVVLFPGWVGLLYWRRSAWKVLTILYALIGVSWIVQGPRILLHGIAHKTSLEKTLAGFALYLLWMLASWVFPLLVLLTDRPEGWSSGTENERHA